MFLFCNVIGATRFQVPNVNGLKYPILPDLSSRAPVKGIEPGYKGSLRVVISCV